MRICVSGRLMKNLAAGLQAIVDDDVQHERELFGEDAGVTRQFGITSQPCVESAPNGLSSCGVVQGGWD